jgi:RimJ/RimL family protein N-acetyltransferase
MAETISIRMIREKDREAFKAMRLEALREHPEAFRTDHEESSREPETVWIERVGNAIDSPKGCIVLAETNGELVGMSGVYRDARSKVRHSAVLWGVYVRRKFRGKKLSERLIAEALNWCRANDVRILRLTVNAVNGPAIRAYLRCGFAICGISPEEVRIGDTYYDEMLMWRRV